MISTPHPLEAARVDPPSAPVPRQLSTADLSAALAAGWADFRAQPLFGLFFAAVYVIGGILLANALVARGEVAWLAPAIAGFPLIAPFTAIGLYEVSRRREAGLPLRWGAVLGAVRGQGDGQILMMGTLLFVGFGFWIVLARGLFAIFMADAGLGRIGADPLSLLGSGPGLMMLLVGGVIGAAMALAFFAITVVSLPMLVDREVDVITAIITSLGVVRANTGLMIGWALLIAVSLFAAMLPLFLGLLVVLPLFGHATWHLYRRAVAPAG